jgi:segregation and condensation protein A
MAYSVKLEKFEGPLDLLLNLIEQEKLDISQVSLAMCTDGYLKYLDGRPDIPPEELVDFLTVAAKLLLLKSQILLPFLNAGEAEGEGDLESQLRIYKEYLDASKVIESAIGRKRFLFVHERLPNVDIGFAPPKRLTTQQMTSFMQVIIARLQPLVVVPKAVVERVVSIHERIRQIREVLGRAARLSFRELLSSATSRTEIVVSFLAILELIKQHSVSADQEGQFTDIVITRLDAEAKS